MPASVVPRGSEDASARGAMSDWTWDRTLFAGTAPYYSRGRLPYDASLVQWVGSLLRERGLEGLGALLDVGCGPGTLTKPLSALFSRTLGVDPDPEMIELARRMLDDEERTRVQYWCERAEEMELEPGAYTLATFGQSFHWMDRVGVARQMRAALVPGGIFALVSDLKNPPDAAVELVRPTPPHAAVTELLREWLGPVRMAGQSVLPQGTPRHEEVVLEEAGFVDPRRVVLGGGQVMTRSVDDVVAGVFSRSDSAPHLFGERLDEFEAVLRRRLEVEAVDGFFDEVQAGTEIRYWSNPGPR